MDNSLPDRCANWGKVMRRHHAGGRVSLIWDGYARARSWSDDGPVGVGTDPQDAWVIERAWSDPRLFKLHRVILSYHWVYLLSPPHACRLIFLHHKTKWPQRTWARHVDEAMADLGFILEVQKRNIDRKISIDTQQVAV